MDNTQGGGVQKRGFSAYLPIVVSTIVFAFIPSAMQSGALGIFLPQLAAEFQVPNSTISFYITLGNLAVAVSSLIVGQALARFDVRAVSTVLVCGVALCFLGMSAATAVWQIWVCGALLTATAVPIVMLVNPTLINRWFKDRAGFFIGLASAFIGIGGIVFLQVGQAIIDTLGYRTAYVTYAVVILVCCLPCSLFLIRSHPEDRGLTAYTSGKTAAEATGAAVGKPWNVDVSAAMKSPAFWLVGLIGGLFGMALLINPQWPTYIKTLTEMGTTVLITGAVMASIVSGAQVIGKIVFGTMGDASPMKAIGLASILGVISMLLVWLAPSTVALPLGAVFFGFYFSVSGVLLPILARAVFGTGDSYSILFGRALMITKLLTAPGAVIWPLVAENFGGFGAAFACIIVLIVLCVALSALAIKLGARLPRVYSDGTRVESDTSAPVKSARPAEA